jgi:ABC-2 type transport system permease protein
MRKVSHDFSEIIIRAVQPVLWLLIFGQVFAGVHILPTGSYGYLQFLTPGILAQSAVFVSIFYGLMLVWERDLGLLHKLLSTPAPRYAIVIGKAFAAGARSILQAIMVLVLALVIRVNLRINFLSVLGVLLVILLSGICFSSLSMFLACLLKTRERVMGIGQVITMPLFFASSAIYPVEIMPNWLKVVAQTNPLSYVVDCLRALLVTGQYRALPMDMGILVLATILMIGLASLSFSRIIQ